MENVINLSYSKDECVSKFANLKKLKDVAGLLKIDHNTLIYYLYRINTSNKYEQFKIPKKTGGVRTISSPVDGLKIIQQKLNYILQYVHKTKKTTFGFTKDRSIVDNANQHLRTSKNVLNLDIEDFFGSINFGRVRGLFMAHPYSLSPEVSTVLAQICCYQNKLPQGSPTSPVISNMICGKMDDELKRLASMARCVYTRYADDITFSTNQYKFPSSLVNYDEKITTCGVNLQEIIRQNGFSINMKKFRIKRKSDRQEITGVVINCFLNVKREFNREIRAMIHAWEKFGLENAQKVYLEKYNKHVALSFKDSYKFENVLKGKIEFLGMVRGRQNYLYINYLKALKKLNPELVNKPLDELDMLYEEYKNLYLLKNAQARGIVLEKMLNSMLLLFELTAVKSFKRSNNSEQIDGAFKFEGWNYLVECKWEKKISSPKDIDHLYGAIERSGMQTMGLFITINGWGKSVIDILNRNPHKQIILMDGEDLEAILSRKVDFVPFFQAKIQYLNQKSRPDLGWEEYLKSVS